jgi:hypothetical protein
MGRQSLRKKFCFGSTELGFESGYGSVMGENLIYILDPDLLKKLVRVCMME